MCSSSSSSGWAHVARHSQHRWRHHSIGVAAVMGGVGEGPAGTAVTHTAVHGETTGAVTRVTIIVAVCMAGTTAVTDEGEGAAGREGEAGREGWKGMGSREGEDENNENACVAKGAHSGKAAVKRDRLGQVFGQIRGRCSHSNLNSNRSRRGFLVQIQGSNGCTSANSSSNSSSSSSISSSLLTFNCSQEDTRVPAAPPQIHATNISRNNNDIPSNSNSSNDNDIPSNSNSSNDIPSNSSRSSNSSSNSCRC